MNRLTFERNIDGVADVGLREGVTVGDAVCRLADYEAAGLEPGEIAALDRLAELVERLEKIKNLALLADLAGKPVQPVVHADFGECVQIPVVPDTDPGGGPTFPDLVDEDGQELAAEP